MAWYSSRPLPSRWFQIHCTEFFCFLYSATVCKGCGSFIFCIDIFLFYFPFFSYKDMSTVCSNARANIKYFYANNPMTPNVSYLVFYYLIIYWHYSCSLVFCTLTINTECCAKRKTLIRRSKKVTFCFRGNCL